MTNKLSINLRKSITYISMRVALYVSIFTVLKLECAINLLKSIQIVRVELFCWMFNQLNTSE